MRRRGGEDGSKHKCNECCLELKVVVMHLVTAGLRSPPTRLVQAVLSSSSHKTARFR
jgi:hypothetical protein